MEKREVSVHEVRIFEVLRSEPNIWFTIAELREQANVARRTAALHAKRFVDSGLLDVMEMYPGFRYRWAKKAGSRDAGYLRRLEQAAEVLAKS